MAHRQWQDANLLANKNKNEGNIGYLKKHEQMSLQQQLIEEKKQEIIRRQEEKKKKETEEALKKLNENKLKSSDSSRSKRSYYGYSKNKHWRDKQEESKPTTLPANIFNNDGSFFEQFQKLSGIKVTPKKKKSEKPNDAEEASNTDSKPVNTEGGNEADNAASNNLGETKASEDQGSSQFSHKEMPNQDQLVQKQFEHQQQRFQHYPQQQNVMNQQTMPQQAFQHPMQQLQQHSQQPLIQQPQQQQPMQHPMQSQQPIYRPMQQQQLQHNQQGGFMPRQMPPMSPRMPMNYPPQFNPMQCGMMLPPPLTPSSIPPPAPLNPGSIPSPSPLQPRSIPSPSPLQPYAIPPPSPLIPQSIPPPSPMVPHSIPPPSPLTPHSIPPPLPIRPQNIPPPMQRPPMFLNMVPPPPPPPVEQEKRLVEPTSNDNQSENRVKRGKLTIKENVKDLFKNDDYSSSDEEDRDNYYKPDRKKMTYHYNSDSDHDQKSADTNSDKESEAEYPNKGESLSEFDSELGHESQSANASKSESDSKRYSMNGPIVIEDTQTQFPYETKESSNTGDTAPADQSSDGDSNPLPHKRRGSGLFRDVENSPYFWQEPIKNEPEDSNTGSYDIKPKEEIKEEKHNADIFMEPKQEFTVDCKQDFELKLKQEVPVEECSVKHEDPPKKKRRSRWASEEEKVDILPETALSGVQQGLPGVATTVQGIPTVSEMPVGGPGMPPGIPKMPQGVPGMPSGIQGMPPGVPGMFPGIPGVPHGAPGVGMPQRLPGMPTGIPPPPGVPTAMRPLVGQPGIVVPTALGGINTIVPPPPIPQSVPNLKIPGMTGPMISMVTRSDPALVSYAMKAFGRTNLTDAEWKKAEEHYKINLLYQDMMKKKEELERLQAAGKNKYEYDSDEETEGGTWEHKLRMAEMEATQLWAEELTEAAKGKHHIGDFLPPDELARFMEKYEALKEGREPDLSDYKEFKLKEDNVGFQMLQKLGWTEGQGLGPDGSGVVDPVNKAAMRVEGQGLGLDRPDDVEADDDEYDAYRKRMMLAYRFRPNPMNNPRRPYY